MKKSTILLLVGLCGIGCYYYVSESTTSCEVVTTNNDVVVVTDEAPLMSNDATSKMHKYRLNKMWRDLTVDDLVENDGAIIDRYILNDEEYRVQLGLKLEEEAAEVAGAKDKKELIEEIADVFEVLDCIIAFNNIDKQEIETVQKNKRDKRGSFLTRQFITTVQAVDGSYLHNYYLKSPDRHQEILD